MLIIGKRINPSRMAIANAIYNIDSKFTRKEAQP